MEIPKPIRIFRSYGTFLRNVWCPERGSNPHGLWPRDFKSLVSACSTIRACPEEVFTLPGGIGEAYQKRVDRASRADMAVRLPTLFGAAYTGSAHVGKVSTLVLSSGISLLQRAYARGGIFFCHSGVILKKFFQRHGNPVQIHRAQERVCRTRGRLRA